MLLGSIPIKTEVPFWKPIVILALWRQSFLSFSASFFIPPSFTNVLNRYRWHSNVRYLLFLDTFDQWHVTLGSCVSCDPDHQVPTATIGGTCCPPRARLRLRLRPGSQSAGREAGVWRAFEGRGLCSEGLTLNSP